MCSTDPASMKTAATVLQELMMKRGRMPEYECIGQTGLNHQTVFEYLCKADGVSVRATGRSKKDAKQTAARRALAALAARGDIIPPPYNIPLENYGQESKSNLQQQERTTNSNEPPQKKYKKTDGDDVAGAAGPSAVPSPSYVALLKELCEQYSLAAPEYCLISDTGPPHQRRFTISAAVGKHKFQAMANNKRAARQAAADMLYRYLRENLARLTDDFNEEEALVRAHEKAMERYVEVAGANTWRPNLGQKVADYHLGLREACTEEQRLAALAALDAGGDDAVMKAFEALSLEATVSAMGPLLILSAPRASPPLAFAALAPASPEEPAARYLRLALTARPRD